MHEISWTHGREIPYPQLLNNSQPFKSSDICGGLHENAPHRRLYLQAYSRVDGLFARTEGCGLARGSALSRVDYEVSKAHCRPCPSPNLCLPTTDKLSTPVPEWRLCAFHREDHRPALENCKQAPAQHFLFKELPWSQSLFIATEPRLSQGYTQRTILLQRYFLTVIITARNWQQPRCPSKDECITKMWCIYTMEHYSAVNNEIIKFASKLMELETINPEWGETPP